ncbi:MAG: hypothetical protein OEY51_04060 [Cyclobacteriaceae bacterium]|nr:hypothetical protein [Cyclobacteriaceae bacterium]
MKKTSVISAGALELFAEVKNFYSSPSTGIIRHKLRFAKLAPGGGSQY